MPDGGPFMSRGRRKDKKIKEEKEKEKKEGPKKGTKKKKGACLAQQADLTGCMMCYSVQSISVAAIGCRQDTFATASQWSRPMPAVITAVSAKLSENHCL